MRSLVAVCMLLASSALLAQDGAPLNSEDVIKEVLKTMDQLTAALKTVEDEKTAEAARPELRKAAQRFVELRTKAESVKPPNREEKTRLEDKYKTKLTEAQKKLFVEIGRVRTTPGGKVALNEIQAVVSPKK